MPADNATEYQISTIEVGGRRFAVTCRIGWDGIEHVGRLWFADESWDDDLLPDRGALPGRSEGEVLALARRLTPEELEARYHRARAEKRRFTALRKTTDEILEKIRYLNQVTISMRAGLLDVAGAAAEVSLTEQQMHELVDQLRGSAGVET